MNEYKLYLDDIRDPKSEGWTVVRNYEQFVKTITEHGTPAEISFDHDLGWDEVNNIENKSGYDCAKWLVENNICLEKFNVHSANPVGAENISSLLNNFKKHIQSKSEDGSREN